MLYFVIINLLSFLLFCLDKRKAIKHKYRIPEYILIAISIIGGCFGSLLGMMLWHHKNRKIKFIIIIPITCLIWLYIILKIDAIL